ncbi:endonuclease/exonuclease/phosphatase family protein [Actinoplanes subtropicus]|uniref:endonuclease/exonuclease/phosphatase family protein n=1 Tax=Actinoplanes subtropicus TaxID=543632 RepID=UPI0004C34316|nr:endonuclease/exonuclease/phosphatase family protein [Actinoplanes subtropicus]
MRIRLALAALVAVLTVLTGAPVVAPAAPPAVKVVTFNLCGNVCRYGEVAATSGNIAYRIRKIGASVAMLQELCYSQFLGIRGRLARYGYTAEFAAASNGGHCDDDDHKHGKAFGIALIVRGTMTGKVVHRLPNPEPSTPEERVVLAATVRLPGRSLFAATTHTTIGSNLPVQLAAIRRWLAPLAAGQPLVFGGDLNISPQRPELDGFYAAFTEANVDREKPMSTFIPRPSRKIDYLFGSKGFLTPIWVGRADTGYSDHDMYMGAFR